MMAEVQVRIEPPTGTPRSFAIESTTREGIIEAKSTLRAKGDRHVQVSTRSFAAEPQHKLTKIKISNLNHPSATQ